MSKQPAAFALFDLDGTVSWGDTFLAYSRYLLFRRPERLAHCLDLPTSFAGFALGYLSNDALKERLLTAVAGGCRSDEIEAHATAFAARCVACRVKPTALARIAWHREQDHHLILASAALDLYVPRLAKSLGFDEVVCTRAAWRDDVVSGRLDGPNLRGEAKLAALRDALGWSGRPVAPVFAYSDHHSDLPLLCFADHGVAVDPTRQLAACAAARGLRIEHWDGRARGGLLAGRRHRTLESGDRVPPLREPPLPEAIAGRMLHERD
jgi:HAD superfamily hydrolase (TIGR01490 family)